MASSWKIHALMIMISIASGLGLGVVGECDCQDKEPRDSDPCTDQKRMGNCEKSWMLEGDYCAISCNRCVCNTDVSKPGCDECSDTPPADEFTCEEQKSFGKCTEEWMKPFCQITCGKCKCKAQYSKEQERKVVPEEKPKKPASQAQNRVQVDSVEQHVPKPSNETAPDQGTNRTWLQSSRATDGVIPASPGSSLVTAAATVPVLKPAPVQKGKTCTKTVMDVLGEGKGFSILIKALKATGIAEILDKPSASLALFAPDDTAFKHFFNDFKLSSEEFSTVLSGKAEAILQYHIVPSVEDPDTLTRSLAPLDTLLDSKKLFAAGKSTVESLASSAKILSTPLPVCGSFIFIVDTVLLPAPSLDGIGQRRAIQRPRRAHSVSSLPEARPAPVYSGAKCTEEGSLAEIIASDPHLLIFSQALEHSGLAKKYLAAWDDEITVLAPTNAAFRNYLLQSKKSQEDLFADKKQLADLLKYHLVPGNIDGQSMKQGSLETLNPKPVFVEVLPASIEIAGLGSSARVLALDVDRQCNGALHKIDQVLLPHSMISGTVAKPGSTETSSQNPLESQTVSGPPTPVSAPPRACKSVADVIASRPNLQILQRAIKLAGLFTALSDKQQSITLFAPMDSAFLALSKSANQLPILTDPAALQSILGYHALSKAMEFDDLKSGKDVPTKVLENGAPVMLSIVEDPDHPSRIIVQGVVGKATVVQRDIVACDSIVHIIDGVLLPADTIDKMKKQPRKGSLSLWTG